MVIHVSRRIDLRSAVEAAWQATVRRHRRAGGARAAREGTGHH